MGPGNQCLASMARLSISGSFRPLALARPRLVTAAAVQTRCASKKSKGSSKRMVLGKKEKAERQKKKISKEFKNHNPANFPQFSLCDALRYLRAVEVGKRPLGTMYEVAIRVKAMRSGPVIKNTIKLPHPISSSISFAVICPEGSDAAAQAIKAGATAVGEETLFERIRNGDIQFERLLCHESSEGALKQANLGRILGPKGLMPSRKLGTITNNVTKTLTGGAMPYRERMGVIRMVVGQMSFTPKQVADNLAALMKEVKAACSRLEDRTTKQVMEVILSSTHGPGFNLNGKFKPTDPEIKEEDLTGPL